MIDIRGFERDWLRTRARLTPERTAIIAGAHTMSFAELDARVDTVARGLVERGARDDDRVALLLPNGVRFVELVHAAPRAGAIIVPLNVRLTPEEMAWQLRDCGASMLIFDDATSDAARALANRDSVRAVHAAELGAETAAGETLRYEGELDRVHSIVYTSGTTGTPKGAMLTYANHLWSAIGSMMNLGLRADDRLPASLPMFHVGGLAVLLRGVLYGNAVVVRESFEPASVNRAIDEDHVTVISVVANMLRRMLDERGARPYPSTLRAVLLGGGPAPQTLLEDCAARGLPILQTYGLTEAASQVATLAPADALRKLGAAGRPLPVTELRIERDGRACAAGEEGEILVRGRTISPGYWGRPDETAAAFRDGWLRTGDVGCIDAEGYLYVLDRRDDLIVSGGENVYPAEVEAALQAHPAVLEAAVYGVPDARWGSVPEAAVVLRPGTSVTHDEMLAWCVTWLARYKTPTRVRFIDALPRNAAGKVQRRALREQAGVPATG